MNESPEHIARAFVDAINHQDVDRLAALMAPEHRFIDSLGNLVEGRDKMRVGWIGYFKIIPDYQIAVDECFCEGLGVVFFGVATGTFVTQGELKPENRWRTPVALRATIGDGLVTEWRVYADNEPLRALMRKA